MSVTLDPRRGAPGHSAGGRSKSFRHRVGQSPARQDIQGLRALAVSMVVVNHVFGWPSGGFVGVDVFFVISGFLITGLLHREHVATGRISLVGFYRRRARRILPISSVVLLATVAAGYALYLGARARQISIDAAWALLFSANWHFAALGTDYLANDRLLSPVQHYWSLAVEEQFYLVWPWVLVGVLGLGLRRGWPAATRTRNLFALMSVLTLASFGWAWWESLTHPARAYFSTFARAWELGLGALLAIAEPALRRLPERLRPGLAWLGLIGVLASLFLITGRSTFPAPWAALPVVGTGLVLAAGTGARRRGLLVLANPVARYLGDISYSLYLWHFPVVVVLAALVPRSGLAGDALLLGLIFALAVLSYHLVENPVRRSSWLEPSRRRDSRSRHQSGAGGSAAAHPDSVSVGRSGSVGPVGSRSRSRRRTRRARRYLRRNVKGLTALAVTAVAASLMVGAVVNQSRTDRVRPAAAAPRPSALPSATAAADLQTTLTTQINAALNATAFPALNPAVDRLGIKNWSREVAQGGCFDIDATNASTCTSGSGSAGKDVAVLGDSYAVAWMPAVRAAFETAGWKVHPLTEGQCPAISVSVTKDGGAAFGDCDTHRRWALDQVRQLKPDLVILADAANTLDRLKSSATGDAAVAEITRGAATTLASLAGPASRTIVLSPPPDAANLQDCVTRISRPSSCTTKIKPSWWTFRTAVQAAHTRSARYLDTSRWFCNSADLCPGFVGTTPVRVDGSHLSVAYSRSLGPLLARAILG